MLQAVGSRLDWGWVCCQSHSVGIGRAQLFAVCCWRHQFLAPWTAPHSYSQRGSLHPRTRAPREYNGQWESMKMSSKMEARVFYNLILQGTSNHFCWILGVGNESLDPVHIQGQITHQMCTPGSEESLGDQSLGRLPRG